jgi:hypothetical protein
VGGGGRLKDNSRARTRQGCLAPLMRSWADPRSLVVTEVIADEHERRTSHYDNSGCS